MEEKGLWRSIIVSKYGSWRSIDLECNNNSDFSVVKGSYKHLWKVREETGLVRVLAGELKKEIKFIRGMIVVEENPCSRNIFLDFFVNSTWKGLKLEEFWTWHGQVWDWKFYWRRTCFAWKKWMVKEYYPCSYVY